MTKLMTLITALLMTSLVGCGSTSVAVVVVNKSDVFENEYAKFSPPDNWLALNEANWKLQYAGTPDENNKYQWFVLESKDYLSTISIRLTPYKKTDENKMKVDDKKFLHDVYRERTEQEKKDDKMKSIFYRDAWISYLANAKCTNYTFTRGMAWKAGHFLGKNYSFTCRYYDKTEKESDGRRKLSISYRFITSDNGNIDVLNTREHELINAVKEIVDSLIIKNIDVERMKRERIYYENQPFFVPEEALLPL